MSHDQTSPIWLCDAPTWWPGNPNNLNLTSENQLLHVEMRMTLTALQCPTNLSISVHGPQIQCWRRQPCTRWCHKRHSCSSRLHSYHATTGFNTFLIVESLDDDLHARLERGVLVLEHIIEVCTNNNILSSLNCIRDDKLATTRTTITKKHYHNW